MRADSGFFSYDMIAVPTAVLLDHDPTDAKVKAAIAAIDDDAWAPIEYSGAGHHLRHDPRAVAVLLGWLTDRHDLDTCAADAYHRAHATVELAIRDLKESAGSAAAPQDVANGAWLACCVLAHNLARWTARLGRAHPTRQLTVAATIRNRLLTVPGRLVNHSGRHKLRLPLNWPWANTFTTALGRIRNLPQLI